MSKEESSDEHVNELKQLADIITNQEDVQKAIKDIIKTSLIADISTQEIIKDIVKLEVGYFNMVKYLFIILIIIFLGVWLNINLPY